MIAWITQIIIGQLGRMAPQVQPMTADVSSGKILVSFLI